MAEKRLCKSEQDSVIRLMGMDVALTVMLNDANVLRRLSDNKKTRKRLRAANTNIGRAIAELLLTTSVDQRRQLMLQSDKITYMYYIGRPGLMPVKELTDTGMWFSFRDMNVMAMACRECCKYCTCDNKQEQKQCEIRKLLDKMPADVDHGDGCGWMAELCSKE